MERKSVKLMSPVKDRIEMMKRELKLKTESEVIAYLYLYHDRHYEKVTVKESKDLLESVKHMHMQESIYLNEMIKNKKGDV